MCYRSSDCHSAYHDVHTVKHVLMFNVHFAQLQYFKSKNRKSKFKYASTYVTPKYL